MPVLPAPTFKPPFHHFNGNMQTVLPSAFRKVAYKEYERERIFTPDDDFLDIDWLKDTENSKLVVISHGLEGNSSRHYVRGTAKLFHEAGWDVCAWNCRSCSGEMNWQPRFYHHGDTPDFRLVLDHCLSVKAYQEIFLVGYSMGGSITLRHMGEIGEDQYPQIKRAIAVSVPCYLPDCVRELEMPNKKFYNRRFYDKLKGKMEAKAKLMPDKIDPSYFEQGVVTSSRLLDRYYFAPIHGYSEEESFYDGISALRFLKDIKRPTLLLSAGNDPFLRASCFPTEIAKQNPSFFMEIPEKGGHVGFCIAGKKETYAELRALEFAEVGK